MILSQVLDALLFSAQKPLTTAELRGALTSAGQDDELVPNEFARVKEAEIAVALEQLKVDYTLAPRGFQLLEKADGWQLVSHPDCARWLRQLFPGVEAHLIWGSRLMLAVVDLQPHSIVAEHDHPHEQIGMVVEGRAEFTIGGETRVLGPGDRYLMPGGVRHKVVPMGGPCQALDVFYPIRDEYR